MEYKRGYQKKCTEEENRRGTTSKLTINIPSKTWGIRKSARESAELTGNENMKEYKTRPLWTS